MNTIAQSDEGNAYEKRTEKEWNSVNKVINSDPEDLIGMGPDEDGVKRNLLAENMAYSDGNKEEQGWCIQPEFRIRLHPLFDQRDKGPGDAESQEGRAYYKGPKVRPISYGECFYHKQFEGDEGYWKQEQRKKSFSRCHDALFIT